ncbi:MAG: hypothetical protein KDC38_09700, partial [Planctomycetes bacterium]|nr:hypothetical protein [Planctomycetota bacterium]
AWGRRPGGTVRGIHGRDFLRLLMAGATTSLLPGGPESLFAQSKPATPPESDLDRYLAFERRRLEAIERHFDRSTGDATGATPEYDRTMAQVLIALRDPKSAPLFRPLVDRFPDYAQLTVIGPEERGAAEWGTTLSGVLGREVRVVPAARSAWVEVWAQDILEPVRVGDRVRLVLPLFYRYGEDLPRDDARQTRVHVDGIGGALQSKGIATQPVPFYFHGGDLAFDRIEDRPSLLTTVDPLLNTQRYYRQVRGGELDPGTLRKRMATAFGVERVEILTTREARRYTLHLDQVLCLLPGRKALVTRIVEDPAPLRRTWDRAEIEHERRRCDEVRRGCVDLGYEILDAEVTPQQLAESRVAVNAIPYRHRTTERRHLLMPTWPGMSTFETEAQLRTVRRIEANGIEVALVTDEHFHEFGGSLHCITNVLE